MYFPIKRLQLKKSALAFSLSLSATQFTYFYHNILAWNIFSHNPQRNQVIIAISDSHSELNEGY